MHKLKPDFIATARAFRRHTERMFDALQAGKPAHPSNAAPQSAPELPHNASTLKQELQRRQNILRQILRTNTPSQLRALSASLRLAPASSQSAPSAAPLSFTNPTTAVNPAT